MPRRRYPKNKPRRASAASLGRRRGLAQISLRPLLRSLVASLLACGAVIGLEASTAAATCQNWAGTQPPNTGTGDNVLSGVVAVGPCKAWAVGYHDSGATIQTLIERWNGTAWKVQKSPPISNLGSDLTSVSAASSTSAWAVGYETDSPPTTDHVMALRWNGKSWSQSPIDYHPVPDSEDLLFGVAATSSTNAWAVGQFKATFQGTSEGGLILRWSGGPEWEPQRTPNTGSLDDHLLGIAATSATNAWAVGYSSLRTFVVRWNGKAWRIQPSPSPGTGQNHLSAVAATSTSNAWAVGYSTPGSTKRTLIEHWDGKAWQVQASPTLGTGDNEFLGVAATSTTNAWAVGYYVKGNTRRTLIEHWNGTVWKVHSSPNLGTSTQLSAISATSGSNAWAVGQYSNGTVDQTFAIHCC